MRFPPALLLPLAALPLAFAVPFGRATAPEPYPSLEAWGEALFFDADLSKNRTESCSSCHDPERAFTDPRETAAGQAVSPGDDGVSLGDRNAPTAMYAVFSPPFARLDEQDWIGGQFHDGRAETLADQAIGPFLNPIEMGMENAAAVISRLREDPRMSASLDLYAPGADDEAAYRVVGEAIASFEETPLFAPFSSKYDRFLRGEAELTDQEELGRLLFFSDQFTNCRKCHQLKALPGQDGETFTNYKYRNIGVPANVVVRAANGSSADRIDHGLMENPAADAPQADGRFKVPTLRNVAVTGPYMHNGVFADLRTVVAFYNKYNSHAAPAMTNPETGAHWSPPEVEANIALPELEHGPALDDERVDAIVAFLRTLTDERYEPLLNE